VLRVNIESAVITSELPGRTAAFMIAEIRPQVNGLIQKRLFTEGTDVKAGPLIRPHVCGYPAIYSGLAAVAPQP